MLSEYLLKDRVKARAVAWKNKLDGNELRNGQSVMIALSEISPLIYNLIVTDDNFIEFDCFYVDERTHVLFSLLERLEGLSDKEIENFFKEMVDNM